jgi:hypothetical protein
MHQSPRGRPAAGPGGTCIGSPTSFQEPAAPRRSDPALDGPSGHRPPSNGCRCGSDVVQGGYRRACMDPGADQRSICACGVMGHDILCWSTWKLGLALRPGRQLGARSTDRFWLMVEWTRVLDLCEAVYCCFFSFMRCLLACHTCAFKFLTRLFSRSKWDYSQYCISVAWVFLHCMGTWDMYAPRQYRFNISLRIKAGLRIQFY